MLHVIVPRISAFRSIAICYPLSEWIYGVCPTHVNNHIFVVLITVVDIMITASMCVCFRCLSVVRCPLLVVNVFVFGI